MSGLFAYYGSAWRFLGHFWESCGRNSAWDIDLGVKLAGYHDIGNQ